MSTENTERKLSPLAKQVIDHLGEAAHAHTEALFTYDDDPSLAFVKLTHAVVLLEHCVMDLLEYIDS